MLIALKKYLSGLVIVVVALQVLNLGLYAQDFETVPVANGMEQNIINSVTEYIAEVVLHKVNAFPEKKESSTPGGQGSHELLFKFQPFKIIILNSQERQYALIHPAKEYNCFCQPRYANQSKDIVSPPPKA